MFKPQIFEASSIFSNVSKPLPDFSSPHTIWVKIFHLKIIFRIYLRNYFAVTLAFYYKYKFMQDILTLVLFLKFCISNLKLCFTIIYNFLFNLISLVKKSLKDVLKQRGWNFVFSFDFFLQKQKKLNSLSCSWDTPFWKPVCKFNNLQSLP